MDTLNPRLFPIFLALFLLSPSSALACLNDRDTLAEEIKGLPDVVQVVTGRFERNPPLYYQMRLARVSAELKSHPALLPDYDDAGVACDRLGRDDESIAWMEKKQAQLRLVSTKDPAVQEQWYRYHANIGTFRVDRWVLAGADRKKIAEVQKARADIAEAIKIKPDAHFGREKYQLQVMDWIIKGRPFYVPANILDKRSGMADTGHDTTPEQDSDAFLSAHLGEQADKTKALCGLITLGNAWESLDVFQALGDSIPFEGGSRLYPLVKLRCDEMIDSGHHSLIPGSPTNGSLKDFITIGNAFEPVMDEDKRIFHRLRTEADHWQKQRADYMMARLTTGHHPDTDPAFWNEYHDAGPPAITDSWQHQFYRKHASVHESESSFFLNLIFDAFLFGFILLVSGLVTWRVRLRRRKRRTPKAA